MGCAPAGECLDANQADAVCSKPQAPHVVALYARIGLGGSVLWHRYRATAGRLVSSIFGGLGHRELSGAFACGRGPQRCMKMFSKQVRLYMAWVASMLLGSALLWWLLGAVDGPLVWAHAQSVSFSAWCVGVGGLMLSHVLRAGRIRNEWSQRLDLRWHEAWGLLVSHSAWVVLVPMRAGEAVYVWALHQRGQVGVREATLSLVKMRLQDMGILACFAVFFWLPLGLFWRSSAALVLLVVVLPWVFPWVWRMAHQRLTRPKKLPATVPHWGPQNLPINAQAERLLFTQVYWMSWFYAVSNWAVKLLAIAWPLSELGGLDLHLAVAAALGGEWGAAMPFQPPAGLGPYEAGAWAGALWAQHAAFLAQPLGATPAPLALHLPAAFLVVHLMALAVTVTSAVMARLLGWSQRPFLGIEKP